MVPVVDFSAGLAFFFVGTATQVFLLCSTITYARLCPLTNMPPILPLYHKSGLLGLYAALTVSDLFFVVFVEFYGVF